MQIYTFKADNQYYLEIHSGEKQFWFNSNSGYCFFEYELDCVPYWIGSVYNFEREGSKIVEVRKALKEFVGLK